MLRDGWRKSSPNPIAHAIDEEIPPRKVSPVPRHAVPLAVAAAVVLATGIARCAATEHAPHQLVLDDKLVDVDVSRFAVTRAVIQKAIVPAERPPPMAGAMPPPHRLQTALIPEPLRTPKQDGPIATFGRTEAFGR
jgi:hypothetical protein